MFLLDSNVFDYILDNQIDIEMIKSKGELYTTNVQFSEINNVPDVSRKSALLDVFQFLGMRKLFLESGTWSDNLLWDDEQIWLDEVGSTFTQLVGNSTGWHDALIGEIAQIYNLILITNDRRFANRARANNISVLSVEEFIRL